MSSSSIVIDDRCVCPIAVCGETEIYIIDALSLMGLVNIITPTPKPASEKPQHLLSVRERAQLGMRKSGLSGFRDENPAWRPPNYVCIDALVAEHDGMGHAPDLTELWPSRVVVTTESGTAIVLHIPRLRDEILLSQLRGERGPERLNCSSIITFSGHQSSQCVNTLAIIRTRVEDSSRMREGIQQRARHSGWGQFAFRRNPAKRKRAAEPGSVGRLNVRALVDASDSQLCSARICTGSHDRTVQIWDSQTGERIGYLDNVCHQPSALMYVPNWGELFVASGEGYGRSPIRKYDLNSQGWSGDVASSERFVGHTCAPVALESNVRDEVWYSGGQGAQCMAWNRQDRNSVDAFGPAGVSSLCVAVDLNTVIVGGLDGVLSAYDPRNTQTNLWNFQSGRDRLTKIVRVTKSLFTVMNRAGEVSSFELSPDDPHPVPKDRPFRANVKLSGMCLLQTDVERRQIFAKFEREALDERFVFMGREEIVVGSGVPALFGIVELVGSRLRVSLGFL